MSKKIPGGTDKFDDFSFKSFDLGDVEFKDPFSPLGRHLLQEDRLFGIIPIDEVESALETSGIYPRIRNLGFKKFQFSFENLTPEDQRLFVKDEKNRILIHLRLKLAVFNPPSYIKSLPFQLNLLYIDWLLSQNPDKSFTEKRKAFPGQNFPGLALYKQIGIFIRTLAKKLDTDGVLNSPEYFHDAVLFMKDFNFVDPYKEALGRALLKFRRNPVYKDGKAQNNISLRRLSWAIYNKKLILIDKLAKEKEKEFFWPHGEMLSGLNPEIKSYFESKKYCKLVAKLMENISFYISDF